MMLHSRSLHIRAVDVAVVGLQKQPISGIVLRVGILELPGPSMLIAGVLNDEDYNRCLKRLVMIAD